VKEEVTVTLSPANKKAIDTLKPVVISTRGREELAAEAYEIVAAEGIKAICLIPLVNRGRVLEPCRSRARQRLRLSQKTSISSAGLRADRHRH